MLQVAKMSYEPSEACRLGMGIKCNDQGFKGDSRLRDG